MRLTAAARVTGRFSVVKRTVVLLAVMRAIQSAALRRRARAEREVRREEDRREV